MIDASSRLKGIVDLIDQEQYFVIHAARQSGKTTFLLDMTNRLNAAGNYYALYCSLEMGQGIIEPEKGIPSIINKIKLDLEYSEIPGGKDFAAGTDLSDYANVLRRTLIDFCMSLDKPLVIFFDEADCLSEGTLISFLRQLLDGYNTRSRIPFVHSIVLVGMRNICNLRPKVQSGSDSLAGLTLFNNTSCVMTLRNFTREEITELYGQHTRETGQTFDSEAIDLIWRQTQGQPWLVNTVAREVIVEMLQSDYTRTVTAPLAAQAIQNIILRRDTHIDSLLERLKEARVRKVIEPLIIGDLLSVDKQSDDYHYVCDLGLIRDIPGGFEPSNPIYAEMIIRTLSYNTQDALAGSIYPYHMPRYLKDGKIDMTCLLEADRSSSTAVPT
jgi:hypothetical protein